MASYRQDAKAFMEPQATPVSTGGYRLSVLFALAVRSVTCVIFGRIRLVVWSTWRRIGRRAARAAGTRATTDSNPA